MDCTGLPFVSCLCLTYKRPTLLNNAVACFLMQDYPKKRREIIILDDHGNVSACLEDQGCAVVSIPRRVNSLSEKHNVAASLASGQVFFVWDDDDIYLPW